MIVLMTEINPKVFISYSQDSYTFADKVLEFSNKLRHEGIDAIIDQYEEAPPEGWPRWMEINIENADYIIIIASKGYKQKVLGQTVSGKGVKWESQIIYQQLYNSGTINEKFIPVVFDESDLEYIPTPLQGSTYYNISNQKQYDKLYWRLRGIKSNEKPPLGKLRPLPEKERKTLYVTSMIDIESWNKANWKGAGFFVGFTDLPTLLLPFTNEKYAIKIFKDWISFIGKDDINDEIRIALVEGDVPNEPPGYYIVIGTNLEEAIKRAKKQGCSIDETLIMNVQRIIRANPTDNFANYNYFKSLYKDKKDYYLMPAVVNETNGQIRPLTDYAIQKHKIVYRNLKDISENDEDAILLKN